MENKDPEYSEIEPQNLVLTDLPDITLVRRVIPEHSTKKAVYYVDLGQVEEISSSEFGEPNDIADLTCVIDGIRKSLPEVDIVPTELFWESVAAQQETMGLSELLTSPASRRWEKLRADFLVVAYHQIVDVEEFFTEVVLFGGYRKESLETAAILVIDLRNQKIVHASKVIFEDEDGYARQLFVFTIGYVSTATSDPCNVAGEQAGAAIAYAAPKPASRVVVVAARNNPYEAVKAASRKLAAEKGNPNIPFDDVQAASRKLASETGDPDAMYEHANRLKLGAGLERIWWYCLAAQAGHARARYQVGRYHHHGYVIERNVVHAYFWYTLSLQVEDDREVARQREKLRSELTLDEITEAERLAAEWEPNPAECEEVAAHVGN